MQIGKDCMSNEVEACKPFVREAKLLDVLVLASNIRECDRKEIWHMSRKSPKKHSRLALRLVILRM